MAEDLTEFQNYDTISDGNRVNYGGKIYIFDTRNAGRFGRYRIFESRDPDTIAQGIEFNNIKPIVVVDTDATESNPLRTVETSIDLDTIGSIIDPIGEE